jgi:hypothetical protein
VPLSVASVPLALVRVPPSTILVLLSTVRVPPTLVTMPSSTILVPLNGSAEAEKLSLREVLIMEAIDLDIMGIHTCLMVGTNYHGL